MGRYDDDDRRGDRDDSRSERRGPPPDTEDMHSIKIDNLAYEISKNYLERKFDKFGKVGDVYVPQDRDTGRNRGFAFVRYYDKRDADDAIHEMDGIDIDGRNVRISHASARRPRGSGRGGFGGGGRDGGYGGGRRRRSYSRSRSRSRSRSPRRSSRRSRSHSPRKSRSRSPQKSRSATPKKTSRGKSRSHSKSRSRSRSHTPKK